MQVSLPIHIIRIDTDGFHLMVKLDINGLKANAIVDTGASRTVMDRHRVSYFMGDVALMKEERFFSGIGASQMESFSVHIDQLGLGELSLKHIPVVVIDLGAINKAYAVFDLPRIDLVLGGDVLNHLHAVIDYRKRLLLVSKSL